MWPDVLKEKAMELECIASWASLVKLGTVRDHCRRAIAELRDAARRHDAIRLQAAEKEE